MAEQTTKKGKTFEDWLAILGEAADGVTGKTTSVEQALTLSRITDSAMKVINTAINAAQVQKPPRILSAMIDAPPLLLADEADNTEAAGKIRSELAVVAQGLAQVGLTAPRKAFLTEKRKDLEGKLSALSET